MENPYTFGCPATKVLTSGDQWEGAKHPVCATYFKGLDVYKKRNERTLVNYIGLETIK